MRSIISLLAAAVCLPLAACATPAAIRGLAAEQAGALNNYRTGLQAVADQQSRLNEDNERRLRNLAALRNHNDAYVGFRLTGFAVAADKPAVEIYGLLSARSATEIMNSSVAIAALTPPQAAARATFDGAEVTALIKSLRAAAKPPSRAEVLKSAFAYAQDVKAAYQASLAAAAKDAKEASDAAQQANTAAESLTTGINKVQP